MPPSPTTKILPIVLLLDPWRDNPIRPEQVLPQVAGNPELLQLSRFAVTQTRRSAEDIAWTEWLNGADAMLAAAEDLAAAHPDHEVHYYLSGRAALPLFAYIGIHLSKWARVTVINYYVPSGAPDGAGEWHHVELRPAKGADEQPFFTNVQRINTLDDIGKVAVFVSTEHIIEMEKIRAYMRAQGHPIAGVVEMGTGGERRMLTAETAGAAAAQLDSELQGLRRHFPRHTGVVLFIAGPAQLAVMAGRAVNPNIQGPVEFPNNTPTQYVPALRYPRPAAPRDEKLQILMLGASPNDSRIDFETEFRDSERSLRDTFALDRFEFFFKFAVTTDELMWALNRYDPHVIHLSAHGSQEGEITVLDPTGKSHAVPMEAFIRAIRANARRLRVVILNACYSAVVAEQLRAHVDYTIGIDEPIHDRTAAAFARGFYRALGFGRDLANALEQGRTQVLAENLPKADKIQGFARPGFDPKSWVPFPKKS